MLYVILASNSNRGVYAFGSPKLGKAFSSEANANAEKKSLEARFPGMDFLVLELDKRSNYEEDN